MGFITGSLPTGETCRHFHQLLVWFSITITVTITFSITIVIAITINVSTTITIIITFSITIVIAITINVTNANTITNTITITIRRYSLCLNHCNFYVDLPQCLSPSLVTGDDLRPDLLISTPSNTLYVLELSVGF